MKYLTAYSYDVQAQVRILIETQKLGELLLKKYSTTHTIRNDKALFDYVMALKNEFLRGADPLSKVAFDSKLESYSTCPGHAHHGVTRAGKQTQVKARDSGCHTVQRRADRVTQNDRRP